ncbi:ExbD/TolR family protein [Anabaenopsis elenkinii]|uniref:Biopolymer transporter ExbD n=1 Tax=Anabaenopsis elenkinii CCIBt3563 TaxID=2779889 RepID=A0A7S6U6P7_9CYAN|nr:biopolymer transporter ExbD [Anabaenopsis elenkinii]QOV23488.1 biopolymer transporter ExbD [Anabaenopsis elenkinii CCIBt3563]
MKINLQSPVEETQIQILPLIDVVFCILTFFLLAALQFTRQQAINIDLPKASTSTATGLISENATRIITLDAIGNLYIEKQPVQRDQLVQNLRKYLADNPNGTLVLNASRTATYNDVISILDLMRQVGGDRVSLGIIPGPSPLSSDSFNNLPSFPMVPVPGINPNMISPVLPTEPAPQVPVAPETTPPPES